MNPRALVVEFIGTFFLVFTVGMVVIDPGAGVLAPVAGGGVAEACCGLGAAAPLITGTVLVAGDGTAVCGGATTGAGTAFATGLGAVRTGAGGTA